MSRYDLTDREWRVIEPVLPNKPRGVRRVVSGELRPLLPEAPGHEGVDIARWPSGGDAFEGLR